MLCAKCQAEIPPDAAYCPKCGNATGFAASAARAATPTERLQGAQTAGAAPEPEQQLWQGSFSPKAMYGGWALAAFVTIVAIVLAALTANPAIWIAAAALVPAIWVVLALLLLYRRLGVSYTLTNQRFLHQRGLLRRVSNRILLIDIDDVSFEQGLIERIVNVGTITLTSTDATDPKLPMHGIDNVQHVANLIDDARREERRKRAIYMANV